MTETTKMKKRRKHWYKLYTVECVLCGRSNVWRERMFGRKPARQKRYDYRQEACHDHFL